jgi:SAM-dependent methyltransferase
MSNASSTVPGSQLGSIARIQEAVRFSLPIDSGIAVASGGRKELLELGGMRTWELTTLDEVCAQGAQFLLVPDRDPLLGWHQDLREGLRECRIVLEEPEVCTIFALQELEAGKAAYRAPDGLPLPSPEMIALTVGIYDPVDFYQSGLGVAENAAELLESNELSMDSFRSILDFGCGCGRILRHWRDLPADIQGVDYNPYFVDWCANNLTFASFERNLADRRLSYDDGAFDFIFAFSVFTHLAEDVHDYWLREMKRVMAPEGILLMTVHGSQYLDWLGPQERRRFDSGELVIQNAGFSGANICGVFHSERYIRETLAQGFDVVDLAPGAMRKQDGVLLRKTA